MINKYFLILISCLALTIFAACTSNESSVSIVDSNEPLITEPTSDTPILPTVTADPTETPAPTETSASPESANTVPESITHTLDLYPLQLNLPSDWTVTEKNRREEPTDEGLILGHDCADYIIANSDSTLQIHLLPACGLGEGINFLCPSDTVVVGPSIHRNSQIVRFYDPHSQTYGYTEADEELAYCADSPKISYIDGKEESYILIDLDYTGNEAELSQIVEITDEIIRSIAAQPRKATGPALSPESALTRCADVTEIPQIECQSLTAIYTQMSGELWHSREGWLQTPYPCSWEYVQCSDHHVTALSFQETGLIGEIPPEIGNLTNLTSIDLVGNNLSSLPPEIGNLSHLTYLNLADNNLSNLPPEIGELTNLTELYLWDNDLSSLPSEIWSMTNLTHLNLLGNNLSSLPPEIGNLTNLTSLSLWNNELTNLPPEIGNLTNLTELYLPSNNLNSLPPEIGNLANLSYLNLDNNLLSEFPPEVGKLTNLATLILSDNNLNSLPPELCDSFRDGIELYPESLCSP